MESSLIRCEHMQGREKSCYPRLVKQENFRRKKKTIESSEVWETLQTMLSDEREKRLAYLLFHCGLKPREIIRFCPQEWSNVHEIYRFRRNLMARLLYNADQLRWRLM